MCRTQGHTAASWGLGATPVLGKLPHAQVHAGQRLPCGAGGGMTGTVSKNSADSSLQIILPRILDSDNTLTRTGCKTLQRALKLRQREPQGRGPRHSASTSLSTESAQRGLPGRRGQRGGGGTGALGWPAMSGTFQRSVTPPQEASSSELSPSPRPCILTEQGREQGGQCRGEV